MNANTECKQLEAPSHPGKRGTFLYVVGLVFMLANISCHISRSTRPPEPNLEWTPLSTAQVDPSPPTPASRASCGG